MMTFLAWNSIIQEKKIKIYPPPQNIAKLSNQSEVGSEEMSDIRYFIDSDSENGQFLQ